MARGGRECEWSGYRWRAGGRNTRRRPHHGIELTATHGVLPQSAVLALSVFRAAPVACTIATVGGWAPSAVHVASARGTRRVVLAIVLSSWTEKKEGSV